MIKDWSVSAPFSHLAGGMKYQDGKLTVPTTGRYYIYLQIYCRTQGRVYVRANNRVITMIQSPSTSSTMYVGGVFNLTAGDVITFLSAYANFRVFMYSYHTYFGAYLIWKSTNWCVAKSSFFNMTFLLQTTWWLHYKVTSLIYGGLIKQVDLLYSGITRTGALGRRLSNHNDFWKDSQVFLQTDQ